MKTAKEIKIELEGLQHNYNRKAAEAIPCLVIVTKVITSDHKQKLAMHLLQNIDETRERLNEIDNWINEREQYLFSEIGDYPERLENLFEMKDIELLKHNAKIFRRALENNAPFVLFNSQIESMGESVFFQYTAELVSKFGDEIYESFILPNFG